METPNPTFDRSYCLGILVGSTLMPVNLTIVQTGITAATQKAAAQAAILSGDFDFFFGPFSSVRPSSAFHTIVDQL
jgi:hypothetical protein